MREVLFRGKPKNKADYQLFSQIWKENCIDGFVYGSLIVSDDRYYICVSALCMANSLVNNGITTMIEVIPETIGQYTGLTDKNGTKIFEGDIVKAVFKPYFIGSYAIGKVVFENGTFKIAVYQSKNASTYKKFTKETARAYSIENNFIDRNYSLAVIGNIQDNPELLKGGDEK